MNRSNGYITRFAACRDIGHQWDYYEWVNGRRVLVCFNCGTRRTDNVDHHAITSRNYKYPSGYSMKGDPIPVIELRRQLKREADKLMQGRAGDLQRWIGRKST